MPPCGVIALGVDRLLLLLAGARDLRDILTRFGLGVPTSRGGGSHSNSPPKERVDLMAAMPVVAERL